MKHDEFQVKGHRFENEIKKMCIRDRNTQVKNIIKLNQKAKARREQGLFIAEGRKMFLEAPDDWIEKIYVAESMLEDEEVMLSLIHI